MEDKSFEEYVELSFERLPGSFREAIDNVAIVVEDYPAEEIVRKMKLGSKHDLLGLYQGIPLTQRGTWYGMSPTPPDKISLYKKNIEAHSRNEKEIVRTIYEVLIHEIGHYFGMDEKEIREAGF